MNKYKKLTEKQKEIISKYIESRLGKYGIRWFEFEWEETPKYTYNEIATQQIKTEAMGIFNLMLKDAKLNLKIWDNGDDRKVVEVAFSYNHHNGGSNGHDTDLKLMVNKEEVYEL